MLTHLIIFNREKRSLFFKENILKSVLFPFNHIHSMFLCYRHPLWHIINLLSKACKQRLLPDVFILHEKYFYSLLNSIKLTANSWPTSSHTSKGKSTSCQISQFSTLWDTVWHPNGSEDLERTGPSDQISITLRLLDQAALMISTLTSLMVQMFEQSCH